MVGEEGNGEDSTILVCARRLRKRRVVGSNCKGRLLNVYFLEKSMNDDMPLLTCHYSALSTDGGFISINPQSAMSEYFNFSEISLSQAF